MRDTLPYLPTVRKVKKDVAAVNLARKRWAKYSTEQRAAATLAARSAHSKNAAARRAAREAQAIEEPEAVSA